MSSIALLSGEERTAVGQVEIGALDPERAHVSLPRQLKLKSSH
jgi:hypothetical protein